MRFINHILYVFSMTLFHRVNSNQIYYQNTFIFVIFSLIFIERCNFPCYIRFWVYYVRIMLYSIYFVHIKHFFSLPFQWFFFCKLQMQWKKVVANCEQLNHHSKWWLLQNPLCGAHLILDALNRKTIQSSNKVNNGCGLKSFILSPWYNQYRKKVRFKRQ